MDEFESSLDRDKVANWSSKYLDYAVLRQQVDAAAETDDERDQNGQKKAFQGWCIDRSTPGEIVQSFFLPDYR